MKRQKLFASIVAIATTMTYNAQTIALHSTAGVQIFKGNSALVSAYTASQAGDTLYLSGGTFTPPSVFEKKLMIFGAGHYQDSTIATGKTFVNGNVSFNENADQSYLEGVEITGQFSFPYNNSVNNFTLKRCKIDGAVTFDGTLTTSPSTNLALIGNVFMGNVSVTNITNGMFSNNLFSGALLNTQGNYITNNNFLNGVYLNYEYFVFSGHNNVFNNNIFLFTSNNGLAGSGSTGNTYSKNLFVSPTPNFGGTPTTSGNYVNVAQNLIFVNQSGSTFNYAHDYHLQTPTTYVGNDATQVGIYGGAFPYKAGGVPMNPHIQMKNIAPTTDANGNLQIQIQVKAQND